MPALPLPFAGVVVRCLLLFHTPFLVAGALAALPAQPVSPCGFCYAPQADGQRIVIPLESTEVVLDVKPGLVEAEVIQTFTNHTSAALEAIYLYPLPHDATVTQLELRYWDHIVTSEVREKKQARQDYEAAKSAGKKAALLEQHDPSLFSTTVANFLPGETVHVVFRFIQPLTLSADAVEVRFPMVTGEKYFPASTPPGSADASAPTPPKVDLQSVATHHHYAYDISVRGFPVRSIRSSSHRIQAVRGNSGDYQVALAEDITIPDRDFVLRIETQPSTRPEPTVVTQRTSEGDFGLITLFPHLKNTVSLQAQHGYDFLFLIDHSGSMEGTRIESARLGLEACLTALSPRDRFQIVIFDSSYSFYKDAWTHVNGATLGEAVQYVRQITPRSGTEMQPALEASLDFIQKNGQAHQSIIVFLTDGDVGNETSLFKLLETKIGRVRLFTFGIGSAPNAFLIEKMAQVGHGQSRFIQDDASVARELADFFATLEAPVLSKVKLTLLDSQGRALGGMIFPRELPDVFVERPIQAVFSTLSATPTAVRLEAEEDGTPVQLETALARTPARGDGIEKQFGRLWYDELDTQRRRATTPEERTSFEARMLEVGLRFKLVTAFTSRVAVEQRVSRDPSAPLSSQIVPQYRAADQVSGVVRSDNDLVVLSPFSINSAADSGYYATSTMSGSRLRTSLHDTGGAISLTLPRSLLDDIGATKLEDVVPFTLQPEYKSGTSQAAGDERLLDGLPIATPIDAATVSQIDFPSSGAFSSSVLQRRAGEPDRSSLTLRAGDEGLTAATLQSAFKLGRKDQLPVLAILSSAHFPEAQTSALLSARKNFGDDRLYLSAQGRELTGYGHTRLAKAWFEHKFSDDLTLETTFAWHRLTRVDPRQFSLASPTAQYDGLGFSNLDLLTEQVHQLADTFARVQIAGHRLFATITHTWAARAGWQSDKAEWITPSSALAPGSRRNDLALDLDDEMVFLNDRLSLQTSFGATQHRTSGETEKLRTILHTSLGLSWKFNYAAQAFFTVAREEALPRVFSGEMVANGPSFEAVSLPIEHRQSGQVGLRVNALNGRFHGEIALFHQRIQNATFRDWGWERDHREAGAVDLPGGVTRLPFSYSAADDGRREGVMGTLSFNPMPGLTSVATWYDDWSNQGPYQGGNRRASLLTRYTFQRGPLKNLALGSAVSARNALIFNDGYKLAGGIRWDVFANYRWHGIPGRWTSAQINLINLTRCPWQPTRFSRDHGRQVLLSLSQEF